MGEICAAWCSNHPVGAFKKHQAETHCEDCSQRVFAPGNPKMIWWTLTTWRQFQQNSIYIRTYRGLERWTSIFLILFNNKLNFWIGLARIRRSIYRFSRYDCTSAIVRIFAGSLHITEPIMKRTITCDSIRNRTPSSGGITHFQARLEEYLVFSAEGQTLEHSYLSVPIHSEQNQTRGIIHMTDPLQKEWQVIWVETGNTKLNYGQNRMTHWPNRDPFPRPKRKLVR